MSRLSRNAVTLILAAILAGALPAAAGRENCVEVPWPIITLQLVDRGGLAPDTHRALMDETTRIWRTNAASVLWSNDPARTIDAGATSDAQVVISGDRAGHIGVTPRRTLASISFVNGEPTPVITALALESELLLERAHFDGRPMMDHPPALRHRLLGRMLGRVVAHELGHLLFRSPDHTDRGLMRGHHTVDELIALDARRFRIDPPPTAPQMPWNESLIARRGDLAPCAQP